MRIRPLAVVLPLIAALTFVADGVTRALPVRYWSFRAWEALTAYAPPTAPFEPSARYDSSRAFGDLANLGNVRGMRIYRRETFTTDAFGFRNPLGLAASGTVSVLLLGDSFAAGSSVSDELTLAGQLGSTWGYPTYTVGPRQPTPDSLPAFAAHLGMKPGGWVVHQQTYLYNETQAQPLVPATYPPVSPLARFRRSFVSDIRPIRIVVSQAWKVFQDDAFFTNPFAGAVRRDRLQNGDDMLFISAESVADALSPETRQSVTQAVGYAVRLRDAARAAGLGYLAVLVPVKTAVYRHLLDAPETETARMPAIMSELEQQLHAAGVGVLNLFEPLSAGATASAPRHQYVYWRDDTHWNPAGIAIAARGIAGALGRGARSAQ